MLDSYGRNWDKDQNNLDKVIKENNLNLSIEYRTSNEKSPNGSNVKFFLRIKDEMNKVIIDYNDFYPLDDDEILNLLKVWLRNKKINQLLR